MPAEEPNDELTPLKLPWIVGQLLCSNMDYESAEQLLIPHKVDQPTCENLARSNQLTYRGHESHCQPRAQMRPAHNHFPRLIPTPLCHYFPSVSVTDFQLDNVPGRMCHSLAIMTWLSGQGYGSDCLLTSP